MYIISSIWKSQLAVILPIVLYKSKNEYIYIHYYLNYLPYNIWGSDTKTTERQDRLGIHSILFIFFQNIINFLFLHIMMDLIFSEFTRIHSSTTTTPLLMFKLSQLWSVEIFFMLASLSSRHDPLIFKNVLTFWHIKIFQAHLVPLCTTHGIRLFP